MNNIRRFVVGMAVLIFLGPRVLAHEGHDDGPTEQAFKIAKNGEVKLGEDVKFGDVFVKKGKYLLEHRLDGERHVLILSGVTKGATDVSPVEVVTQILASKVSVKKSAVYAAEASDRTLRVTVIQIEGENVDHIPVANSHQATD